MILDLLSYMKSLVFNIWSQHFPTEQTGRFTRPRDDRRSKVGSLALGTIALI